jgi:hypothetical protein
MKRSEIGRVNRRQCNTGDTVGADMRKRSGQPPKPKIRLINDDPYRTISDIKLKRTDTTLDLSQKAVEGYLLADIRKLC